MKKILVMSDTHGKKAAIAAALARCPGADCIIHLGDYSQDAAIVSGLTDRPVYAVRGNCDFSSEAPTEVELTVEGVRIVAVHGHQQGVKLSLLKLGLYALEKEADILLFGHTHLPTEQFYAGATLYNPGSLGEPRGVKATFGVITAEAGVFRIKTHAL
jgi:uncharacterized protein